MYIGVTENLQKRVIYHNTRQGARFTRDGRYKIVFRESYETPAAARKREIQLKKWSRKKKEMLINRFKVGLITKINA